MSDDRLALRHEFPQTIPGEIAPAQDQRDDFTAQLFTQLERSCQRSGPRSLDQGAGFFEQQSHRAVELPIAYQDKVVEVAAENRLRQVEGRAGRQAVGESLDGSFHRPALL